MRDTRSNAPFPGPKRHHFVPRMLQKRFVDSEGYLYACNREQVAQDVYRARPENLFVRTHFYSEINQDGRREPRTEKRLSTLEHAANSVIELIVTAARAGVPPALSERQLDIWYHFLTLQWRRVPDLSETPEHRAMGEEIFADVIAEARVRFPKYIEQIDRLNEPPARNRLIHNSRLESLGISSIVLEALRFRGLAILRVDSPKKQFILASRPVIKLTHPGKTDLRHPECESWLAVAPDIALGLGLGANQISLHGISAENVRYLNLCAAQQSQTIASSSANLIRSIARPR